MAVKKYLDLTGLSTLVDQLKAKFIKKDDAAGTDFGLVKSGGDVTISNGIINVKDDSHNHTIANVDGLQTQLNNKAGIVTLTDENLNDIKTPGFYSAGGGNKVVGKPGNVDAFGLIVYKTASGYIAQDFISGNTNSGTRYTRMFDSSSWSSWEFLPTYSENPTSGQVVVAGDNGTIHTTGFTIAKSVPSNAVFTDTKYTHPSYTAKSSGLYKITVDNTGHVSATTAVTKSDITALGIPGQDTNTTYSDMKGATSSANGAHGLVPQPDAGEQNKFLKGDGTWATPTNTTYGAAGTSLGLVKSGGDVTISSGVITVNDDSHAHTIANVDGLQTALDGKLSTTGNAASATKLANSRTFSITGAATAAGVSFNGTGNVALNVTSLDATKLTGTVPIDNLPAGALERLITVEDQTARFALTTSDVQLGDTVQQLDTGVMYLVVNTSELDNSAGYKEYTAGSATSVPWSGVTGKPSTFTPSSHTHTIANVTNLQSELDSKLDKTANAVSASKWATARAIKIGNTSKNVDGSGNVTWTLDEIGASPKAGNTSLSQLASTVTLGDGAAATILQDSGTYQQKIEILDNSEAGDAVFKFSQSKDSGSSFGNLMEIRDDGNVVANKFTGSLSGNANTSSSASKLSTARTINLTGDVTGSASFDGSKDISITATVKDDSHNHTIANIDGLQDALDGITAGSVTSASKWTTARNINGMSIDGSANRFNYGTCSTAAATAAKTVSCTGFTLATGSEITVKFTVTNTASNPTLNVNGTGAKAVYYNGAAISAGYLKANKTYTFRYNGTQYDLVGDIDTNTTYTLGSFGVTASAGELNTLRGTGVTPTEINYLAGVTSAIQTQLNGKLSTTGTAAAATKLATGRTISLSGDVTGSVSFDGSKDVTITATVADDSHNHTIANVDGLQTALDGKLSTSGTAASATKLATARTIDGVSFDGSTNRHHYGTCSTAAATAAKTVSCSGFTLATGARIIVKFTVTNTASNPTLNVNSTGAKSIYYRGSAISAGYLAANRTYEFVYNGTQYELIGDVDTNTTYSTGNATTSGITKLYTGTGTATDGTMTQNAITTALNGKLSTSGGTMTGSIDMNNKSINKVDSLIFRNEFGFKQNYPVDDGIIFDGKYLSSRCFKGEGTNSAGIKLYSNAVSIGVFKNGVFSTNRTGDSELIIEGIGLPVQPGDVANKKYVDDAVGSLYSVTFTASGWTGSAAPYTQTVNVKGITDDSQPLLVKQKSSSLNATDNKAYDKAFGILSNGIGTTGDGTVTWKVYEKPAINITIGLKG